MRICVFGAGSLGSALGGILARKHRVSLVARRDNVSAIMRDGLRLTGDVRSRVRLDACETVEGVHPPELLIITTKAYDTGEAVDQCRDWVTKDTRVLTLQNGLGNLELLRKWLGARAFGGTISMGAELTRPGVVRVSGLGDTVIGADKDPEGASRIVEAFSSCGFSASADMNTAGHIWAKAIVNACINPTSAVLDVSNGSLVDNPVISRFMNEVCQECELVASANGIMLPNASMRARVRAVARDTSENISSMLQDVRRGRRTEISQINGAFRDIGARKGIHTPLNSALTAMVETLATCAVMEKG